MAMLKPTPLYATVTALLVNRNPVDITSAHESQVAVTYAGFDGDLHSGLTRESCVRVRAQYPEGTEIRNTRQISALSREELEDIAQSLLLQSIDPSWVGANLVVEGIPQFTQLPPGSRLIADNGTALVVDMENAPCKYPADIIEQHHPGHGNRFAQVAIGKRGNTLWVEREGLLKLADRLRLHIPPPVTWSLP